MDQFVTFDYFYGTQSEYFSFYRIPRILVTGQQFKTLSTDAKLLYSLLLDRMGLSSRNGWYDGKGRVYIYYKLSEIQSDLNCGHEKAVKLMAELDVPKGIGLIERVKQGQGRPARIYVKQFVSQGMSSSRPMKPDDKEMTAPMGTENRSADFGKSDVRRSEGGNCRLPETGSLHFRKSDRNNIDKINLYKNQLNQSIHQSSGMADEPPVRAEIRSEVEQAIAYPQLLERFKREDVNEIAELITEVLCSTRQTIRIGGNEVPAQEVKRRFRQLNMSHLEYMFDSLSRNTTKICNIKGYLLTTLYNAPLTMEHYYQAEVQYDLYGQQ